MSISSMRSKHTSRYREQHAEELELNSDVEISKGKYEQQSESNADEEEKRMFAEFEKAFGITQNKSHQIKEEEKKSSTPSVEPSKSTISQNKEAKKKKIAGDGLTLNE